MAEFKDKRCRPILLAIELNLFVLSKFYHVVVISAIRHYKALLDDKFSVLKLNG